MRAARGMQPHVVEREASARAFSSVAEADERETGSRSGEEQAASSTATAAMRRTVMHSLEGDRHRANRGTIQTGLGAGGRSLS